MSLCFLIGKNRQLDMNHLLEIYLKSSGKIVHGMDAKDLKCIRNHLKAGAGKYSWLKLENNCQSVYRQSAILH